MKNKIGVFLRLSYVGCFLPLSIYLGSILSTTILFQLAGFLTIAYIVTKIIEKISSKNLELIKSWELRFLVWLICILWSPIIGLSLAGICLIFLSFLLLMVTLMNSEDFVEFIEELFESFLTDSRVLGVIILGLVYFIYIFITEGWSGITAIFNT